MNYSVEVRNVTGTRLLVVRRRARRNELSRVVPQSCGIVWNYIRENGIRSPGRNVAVYKCLDGGLLDLEVGVEVGGEAEGNGDVVVSMTPAGMVATAAHLGPYDRLSAANDAITTWCGVNEHQLAGPSWEIYGHWSDDPAKLRTDVFYLLI